MKPVLEPFMAPTTRLFWRALQTVFFAVGALILVTLFVAPDLGLHLLWNVLIPVAPALLVLAPGLWRNVCPMGTASMLPYHAGASRRRPIPFVWQGRLLAIAVLLLLVIVPLRHVLLDRSGLITGIVLTAVAVLAGGLGFVFDARSIWCSGLCPVYPVELLYGTKPVVTVKNAHCDACSGCVVQCRDSRKGVMPQDAARRGPGKWAALLLVGGFPGFIVGWYLVPTTEPAQWLAHLPQAYAWPFAGMATSLVVYMLALTVFRNAHRTVALVFAAAAVSAYYWFKLPVMVGLGESSAALIDLSGILPDWIVWVLRIGEILAFGVLLLAPRASRAWEDQPPRQPAEKRAATLTSPEEVTV